MDNAQKLIEDNIKLVYHIVSREYPTFIHDEDIIQSGMLGLCQAAKYWKGTGVFNTYAGRCIRNEINNEFIRRKPKGKVISLDTNVGEDLTLSEVISGEDDVGYCDDIFYNQLSAEEQEVTRLYNMGYETYEISKLTGYGIQKVQKLLRITKIKWRKFNGDFD